MNSINLNIYKDREILDHTINQVFRIYSDNFEKKMQIPRKIIEKRIKQRKYELILMKTNNVIIGFSFIVMFKKFGLIFIDYLAIDKNYHGKGYGRLLFNYIYDYYSKKKKTKLLVLECEDKLINMYTKWGCTKIPIHYKLNDDCPLNLMIRTEEELNLSSYYKIRNELSNFNKNIFMKRIVYNNPDIYYELNRQMTKCMVKIFILINSILRITFGNSRIYYNFPEGCR